MDYLAARERQLAVKNYLQGGKFGPYNLFLKAGPVRKLKRKFLKSEYERQKSWWQKKFKGKYKAMTKAEIRERLHLPPIGGVGGYKKRHAGKYAKFVRENFKSIYEKKKARYPSHKKAFKLSARKVAKLWRMPSLSEEELSEREAAMLAAAGYEPPAIEEEPSGRRGQIRKIGLPNIADLESEDLAKRREAQAKLFHRRMELIAKHNIGVHHQIGAGYGGRGRKKTTRRRKTPFKILSSAFWKRAKRYPANRIHSLLSNPARLSFNADVIASRQRNPSTQDRNYGAAVEIRNAAAEAGLPPNTLVQRHLLENMAARYTRNPIYDNLPPAPSPFLPPPEESSRKFSSYKRSSTPAGEIIYTPVSAEHIPGAMIQGRPAESEVAGLVASATPPPPLLHLVQSHDIYLHLHSRLHFREQLPRAGLH